MNNCIKINNQKSQTLINSNISGEAVFYLPFVILNKLFMDFCLFTGRKTFEGTFLLFLYFMEQIQNLENNQNLVLYYLSYHFLGPVGAFFSWKNSTSWFPGLKMFGNLWPTHTHTQRKEIDCGLGGTHLVSAGSFVSWHYVSWDVAFFSKNKLDHRNWTNWSPPGTFHIPHQNQTVRFQNKPRTKQQTWSTFIFWLKARWRTTGASTWRPQVRPLTSLPWFWRKSTSCWEKVVMEMDLTLCGGLRPLLGHGGETEREGFGLQQGKNVLTWIHSSPLRRDRRTEQVGEDMFHWCDWA